MRLSTKFNHTVARLVKKYTMLWYTVTALLYLAAVPFTIIFFPKNTLVLSVIVLVGGFTSSVAALASAVVTVDDSDPASPDDLDSKAGS